MDNATPTTSSLAHLTIPEPYVLQALQHLIHNPDYLQSYIFATEKAMEDVSSFEQKIQAAQRCGQLNVHIPTIVLPNNTSQTRQACANTFYVRTLADACRNTPVTVKVVRVRVTHKVTHPQHGGRTHESQFHFIWGETNPEHIQAVPPFWCTDAEALQTWTFTVSDPVYL